MIANLTDAMVRIRELEDTVERIQAERERCCARCKQLETWMRKHATEDRPMQTCAREVEEFLADLEKEDGL